MLPVLALVGRPNVGKSTLFNQLTRSRDALVADLSGLTRDRQYGQGRIDETAFIVIDTGVLRVKKRALMPRWQTSPWRLLRKPTWCCCLLMAGRPATG